MRSTSDGGLTDAPMVDGRLEMPMTEFEFTLVLEGLDGLSPESLNAFFEAGCNDATFGEIDGIVYADFTRESGIAAEAIGSAIRSVESGVPGVRVLRVEPDDLVTAADIAGRLGRTRESVRLLIAGERGPGGFPAPISHLKARGRLWRWAEVGRWASKALGTEVPNLGTAVFIAALNDSLELHQLLPQLDDERELREVARVLGERTHLLPN